MPTEDIVRIVRILEYTGPRSWVEKTLATGGVPANGERRVPSGCVIRSATLGSFPEILEQAAVKSGDGSEEHF